MPYNGSGTYTPPAADFPAVSNTLIQASKFNNTINDIATALSTALTKDGQTTPTANIPMGGFALANARLRAVNGLVGTPAWTFENDLDCGYYRIGADNLGLAIAGTKIADFSASGVGITDNLFRILGSADATKKLAFEVDGFTTGTTRTLTPPNANIILSGSAAALTDGRLPLVTAGGLLFDLAAFTYSYSAGAFAGLQISNTSSGGNAFGVYNDGAGASATSAIGLTAAAGAGDASITFSVDGNTNYWYAGGDNSLSDRFALGYSASGAPGSADFMRISTSGAVTLVASATHTISGPLDISAAAAGNIIFPAAANSSANANTFDDYERGTFTPTAGFATTGDLAVAYTIQVGRYVKTGRQVNASIRLAFTPTYTTAAGNLEINTLPYAAVTTANYRVVGTVAGTNANITWPAGSTQLTANLTSGNSNLTINADGSAIAGATLGTAGLVTGNSKTMTLNITYEAST